MEETILNIIFTRFSDYSILYKLALVIILVIITLKIGFDERSPIKNNEFEKNPLKADFKETVKFNKSLLKSYFVNISGMIFDNTGKLKKNHIFQIPKVFKYSVPLYSRDVNDSKNEVKLVSISKMNGTSVMINSIITGTFDLDFLFESTITINIPKLLINNTIKTNFSFSDLVK